MTKATIQSEPSSDNSDVLPLISISIKHKQVLTTRRAGVLLHPTSLPGNRHNGTLGQHAFRFVDFLTECGMTVWQTLPLGPTHSDASPYLCLSAHAGNPALIDIDWLEHHQLLAGQHECAPDQSYQEFVQICLLQAHQVFCRQTDNELHFDYRDFINEHANWLEDYALYTALRIDNNGQSWDRWPQPLKDRDPKALKKARTQLKDVIELIRFEQFVFFSQWQELKNYAHEHDVCLFGDIPIFVAYDSADVWAHRDFFLLDNAGYPSVVAGVPPDYFSKTGQRWGNPHYHWDNLQADGFKWWLDRMRSQLDLFDLVRIDHFRGFESFWAIPAESSVATHGEWIEAPGEALLNTLYETFGQLPLVAEDLGIITKEVEALRLKFKMPGMKILQFAFSGESDNPYLPENHEKDSVVYTGTHDNDTTLSWYESLSQIDKARVDSYFKQHKEFTSEPMPWPLIRCALSSIAQLVILPMQDILGLGSGHRMNTPGVTKGNWHWRFEWNQISDDLPAHLSEILQDYHRVPDSHT